LPPPIVDGAFEDPKPAMGAAYEGTYRGRVSTHEQNILLPRIEEGHVFGKENLSRTTGTTQKAQGEGAPVHQSATQHLDHPIGYEPMWERVRILSAFRGSILDFNHFPVNNCISKSESGSEIGRVVRLAGCLRHSQARTYENRNEKGSGEPPRVNRSHSLLFQTREHSYVDFNTFSIV
jgi:hypothetical protein